MLKLIPRSLLLTLALTGHQAHAAPITLEGTYDFIAKSYGKNQSDENIGCPQRVVVKAEYDPASGRATKLAVWDANDLSGGGFALLSIVNRGEWTESGPHGVKFKEAEFIGDTYAESSDKISFLGFSKTTEKTWVELKPSPAGDELSYEHLENNRCYFLREGAAK